MLDAVREVVLEAGEILKEGFYGSKEVRHKGSKDLVTEYDVRIERFLIEKLQALFPDFGMVAEEGNLASTKADKFVIDPIDGTTNFVHGIPHVAISVGVYRQNLPHLGIVYNPVLNEFFHAVTGQGAYFNGQKIGVTDETRIKSALVATGFPYTSDKVVSDFEWVMEKIAAVLPNVQDIRRLGSASLDLCHVAKGNFEGYYEMNLKPWDVAAGMVIVAEAGGVISDQNGEGYDPFNSRIIVASNGKVHDALVGYLHD